MRLPRRSMSAASTNRWQPPCASRRHARAHHGRLRRSHAPARKSPAHLQRCAGPCPRSRAAPVRPQWLPSIQIRAGQPLLPKKVRGARACGAVSRRRGDRPGGASRRGGLHGEENRETRAARGPALGPEEKRGSRPRTATRGWPPPPHSPKKGGPGPGRARARGPGREAHKPFAESKRAQMS